MKEKMEANTLLKKRVEVSKTPSKETEFTFQNEKLRLMS